ncbi:hypothetical protein [Alienimonas chondri]|uniref:Membrane associated protein n=1 Tax=Alienimonas chondri TaxID=2681879 RepID=A0ABX1VAV1_9PLAN|nr:hypothetical protein [Alienimonas chondri]NNJ25227.1 hypothetical protein [Alienimonas chondri]
MRADGLRSPQEALDLAKPPADDVQSDHFDLLDPDQIVKTIARIEGRIADRFPDAGLRRVCRKLHGISQSAGERSESFGRPNLWFRALIWLLVIGVAFTLVATVVMWAKPTTEELGFIDFVQVLEAGINDVVLIGAALLFLTTLENRIKRHSVLAAIHELRAMAHIIDMHQLNKDPERILHPELILTEPNGQDRRLSAFDLCRYLDYCSEMLSLIGKVAALYVQRFDDATALSAVNEVENLCSGLSRKIWQKIMIIEAAMPRSNPLTPGGPG